MVQVKALSYFRNRYIRGEMTPLVSCHPISELVPVFSSINNAKLNVFALFDLFPLENFPVNKSITKSVNGTVF